MGEIKIKFESAEDIMRYLKAISTFNGDLDLLYKSQKVDGKSLLGILSLGVGNLLNLRLYYGNPEELIEKISFCCQKEAETVKAAF